LNETPRPPTEAIDVTKELVLDRNDLRKCVLFIGDEAATACKHAVARYCQLTHAFSQKIYVGAAINVKQRDVVRTLRDTKNVIDSTCPPASVVISEN
jgi:hypothetical protein